MDGLLDVLAVGTLNILRAGFYTVAILCCLKYLRKKED